MQFYKMQALGNDFVVFGNPAQITLPDSNFISFLCNRHYGVGADCAVFISASKNGDYGMHVYNPDGFEAEMCGNALRCSAQYVAENGFFKRRALVAETKSGIRSVKVDESGVTADIGKAEILNSGNIEVCGIMLPYVSVSLGNPHCVIFTSTLSDEEFRYFGSAIEHHPLFPDGTNVEFAAVTGGNKIAMRVWERGIGETLSCVTGSCACVAAAESMDYCNGTVEVYQPGGVIVVKKRKDNIMYIHGKCITVFKGTLTR